jgi:hypothetical protein
VLTWKLVGDEAGVRGFADRICSTGGTQAVCGSLAACLSDAWRPQALVDVDGNVVTQPDASLLILDFAKLARFCGFGDKLSELARNRRTDSDVFEETPPDVVELLSAWCEKLDSSFWNSPDADHWFNVTVRDPFHDAARSQLKASLYEPWQYLHWYLRLWRNSVEHKKKASVAASFAHMRTLPRQLVAAYEQLEEVMMTMVTAPEQRTRGPR